MSNSTSDPFAIKRDTQAFLDSFKLDKKALKEVGDEAGITDPDELKQLNEDIAMSSAHIVEINTLIMAALSVARMTEEERVVFAADLLALAPGKKDPASP